MRFYFLLRLHTFITVGLAVMLLSACQAVGFLSDQTGPTMTAQAAAKTPQQPSVRAQAAHKSPPRHATKPSSQMQRQSSAKMQRAQAGPTRTAQAAAKTPQQPSVRAQAAHKSPPRHATKPSSRMQRQLSAKMQKTLPWSRDAMLVPALTPRRHQAPQRAMLDQARPPSANQRWHYGLAHADRTVSVRLNKVPLQALADLLGSMVAANIGLTEELANTPLTMRAEKLPWPALLDAAAQLHDFRIHRQGNFLLIHRPSALASTPLGGSQQSSWPTELFRLSYTKPADLKPVIESLFARHKKQLFIAVDERSRSLIVSAPPPLLQTVAALLTMLDVPLRQIAIEGFIVEADKDFARGLGSRIGINRLGGLRLAGTVGDEPSANRQVSLSDDSGLAVDAAVPGAVGGIGILLDRKRLKFELTALERAGKSRIISNPRVLTVENQEAVIFQGDEVPYFTVSDYGTQTQFKEAGIKLTVTPTIVGQHQLMLDIAVSKDTVDTRIESPPITRRHIQTRLLVDNQAVAVIGGIYFNSKTEADVRVPWLHRIPFLGRLFTRSQKNTGSKELLVFISPTMMAAAS